MRKPKNVDEFLNGLSVITEFDDINQLIDGITINENTNEESCTGDETWGSYDQNSKTWSELVASGKTVRLWILMSFYRLKKTLDVTNQSVSNSIESFRTELNSRISVVESNVTGQINNALNSINLTKTDILNNVATTTGNLTGRVGTLETNTSTLQSTVNALRSDVDDLNNATTNENNPNSLKSKLTDLQTNFSNLLTLILSDVSGQLSNITLTLKYPNPGKYSCYDTDAPSTWNDIGELDITKTASPISVSTKYVKLNLNTGWALERAITSSGEDIAKNFESNTLSLDVAPVGGFKIIFTFKQS